MRNSPWTYRLAVLYLTLLFALSVGQPWITGSEPLFYSGSTDLEKNEKSGIWPIIPFTHRELDMENSNYQPPGSVQQDRFTHVLGTDLIGRDVAAGMVNGSKITTIVVLIGLLISLIIGLPLGLISGYFGDHGLRIGRKLWLPILLGLVTIMYALVYLSVLSPAFLLMILFALGLLFFWSYKWNESSKENMPVYADLIIMRLLEVFKSVPALILLLVLTVTLGATGVFGVAVIIGVLKWPRVAQIVRNECLKMRESDYIVATRSLGLSHRKIILRHVLPNILTPLVVALAFSAGSIVLLESALSFLGIGVAVEEQTWGSILSEARRNFRSWWLAVFPGLAIFLTVVSFNVVGENLLDRLDGRRRKQAFRA